MRLRRLGMVVSALLVYSTALWAAEGCTVNAVKGSPTLVRESQTMDVRPNDPLQKGDRVSVGPECQVDMSMNDLAGCRILAGSKLEVTGWKLEKMGVRIVDGNIILNLKKLPEQAAFQVETPTAVAVVRGTQFWGRVNRPAPENPVTTFAVREGVVEITPQGATQTLRLEAGKALDLKLGEASPVVREALPEEMAAMEQADVIASEAKQS